jgi:CcdB protein
LTAEFVCASNAHIGGEHENRFQHSGPKASGQSDLERATVIGKVDYAAFNPTIKIRGTSVVLHPLEIVSIPVDQLGEVVGSLGDGSQLIVAALDELLARAWR